MANERYLSPPELLYLKLTIISIGAKREGFLFKNYVYNYVSPIKESSFVNDFVFNRILDTITRIPLGYIQIYKNPGVLISHQFTAKNGTKFISLYDFFDMIMQQSFMRIVLCTKGYILIPCGLASLSSDSL